MPIKHRAAWVDVDATVYEPEDLVGPAHRLGLTDLIVKAYDPYEGALFGPGRENDSFFGGMIDETHRAGMRVHAWFPICYDPQRLKKHPEWGMVDSNGLRSDEWVCPSSTAWRKEFLAMFKNLLDNYSVDGIHFDYIRFPNAEVCHCPACRAELTRRAGVKWPLGMELIEQSNAQAAWFDYRSDLIHDLAEEFATAIRKWQEGVVVSAALEPAGAINSDGVKLYGQSYRELAPLLDFVAPLAYHQRKGKPIRWVRAVQVLAPLALGFHAGLAWYSGIPGSRSSADESAGVRPPSRLDALRQRRGGALRTGAPALTGYGGRKPRQHAARCRRAGGAMGPGANRGTDRRRERSTPGQARREVADHRRTGFWGARASRRLGMVLGALGGAAAVALLWAFRSRSPGASSAVSRTAAGGTRSAARGTETDGAAGELDRPKASVARARRAGADPDEVAVTTPVQGRREAPGRGAPGTRPRGFDDRQGARGGVDQRHRLDMVDDGSRPPVP